MNSVWPQRKIKTLGEVVTGKTPSTSNPGNFGGSYPFITIPDLDGRVYISNTERTLSEEGAEAIRPCLLPNGAVMMSCIATVGKCGITAKPSFTNQQINSVICNEDVVPRYLYYCFKRLTSELEAAGGGGSVYTNVSKTRFSELEVPLPPRSIQGTIAHILGTLDDKIELNRRMNETLEAMARAIFKSWFVDFDPVRAKAEGRDPGLPHHIADLFPDRFEDSELGEIPAWWEVQSLAGLFPHDDDCVLTGPFGSHLHASDYRAEGVPLILVKHVIDGQIIEDDIPLVGQHKAPELERYRLREGDIVFTRVGAVGRSAYVHSHHVGWMISGQMLRVRVPNWDVMHPRYLAQVFLQDSFISMVEGFALGTTRPSLNTSLLRNFRFLAPTGELMKRFAEAVLVFDQKVQSVREESRTLAALCDALLAKLISGDLRVRDPERFLEGVVA